MWLKGVVLPYSRKCIIYYHTVVNVVKSHQNLWVLRQDLFLYIRDWPQIHNPPASSAGTVGVYNYNLSKLGSPFDSMW